MTFGNILKNAPNHTPNLHQICPKFWGCLLSGFLGYVRQGMWVARKVDFGHLWFSKSKSDKINAQICKFMFLGMVANYFVANIVPNTTSVQLWKSLFRVTLEPGDNTCSIQHTHEWTVWRRFSNDNLRSKFVFRRHLLDMDDHPHCAQNLSRIQIKLACASPLYSVYLSRGS